jgi:hypothetical protein
MADGSSRNAQVHQDLEADFADTNELEAEEPSTPPTNRFWGFSGSLLAFIIGGLIMEGLMFMMSTPQVPLWSTMPFFFIPFFMLLFCTWFWHAKITTLGTVTQQFLVGLTFVTSCVCIAQMMLVGFWIVFVVGVDGEAQQQVPYENQTLIGDAVSNITATASETASEFWQDFSTFVFLSLIALPIPECAATYLVTTQSNRANHHNKNFVINSFYIALGYATGQSLLGVISQALREESRYARYIVPEVPWYELLLWAFNFLAMSAPLQMLVGYGVGLLIAEAREKHTDVSWRRCNFVAWVVRSVYYILYCGWVFIGFWNLWVFVVGAAVEGVLFIIWIKKVESTMPADYLAKVGYLHMFGYGVIPQVEELYDHEMVSCSPAAPNDTQPSTAL